MRMIKRKGFEDTTIRMVINDLKMPVATIGTVEDFTLRAGLFEDVEEVREHFGRWMVLWIDDMFKAHLFDTREGAVEYVLGDD